MTPDAARLLTPSEVCDILRVSRKTLYRLVADGEIPHLRVKRCLRFMSADVYGWLR